MHNSKEYLALLVCAIDLAVERLFSVPIEYALLLCLAYWSVVLISHLKT
jgi:hypothetical protein